ncbi:MAG: hypothetical protein ISS15_13920 [Alphaproteobacteria bacterium]|nr:hypothetical protein [Alphaproteobacteria bacterium]MBL6936198.1 hypothetical protein [Alphaproteobacteria bacterium]MBL7098751.1 hypothetical protein [Alphaproteobacteria bacterium]
MRINVLLAAAALSATVVTVVAAPTATPNVAAAPLHSAGAKANYPRLTKFPDAKIMTAVNALLAGKEKEDRSNYADCLKQIADMKQKPDPESWNSTIDVTYLSARYMTINVVQSYSCAGAYPTNGAEVPINVDLKVGKEIDWTGMFKPGFLTDGDKIGALTKLYLSHYSKKKEDKDCLDAVKQTDPSASAIFWLDSKQGLLFQPDYPHVIAACANPMPLSSAVLAPYLKDTALLAELKAAGR